MRRSLITLSCIIFFGSILSCTSTEYIKTGIEYPSLAENDEVKVYTSSKPEQKYETIGLIRIRGGNQEKRIEDAKTYAREKGGNAVIVRESGILTEPGSDKVVEKVEASTYDTQEFLIIKIETDKNLADKAGKSKNDSGIAAADFPEKISSIDYSTIPRATYNQLINNYKSLQGKMFRGSLYPKKIYKIPAALKEGTGEGDRLVLLTTKSGKNNIYVIVGDDKLSAFQDKIKSGEILDFVYSPFNVYTSKAGKQPVIKFVEEIVEVK